MSDLFGGLPEAPPKPAAAPAPRRAPPEPPPPLPVMLKSTIYDHRGRRLAYHTSVASWFPLVWHHYQNAERDGKAREFQDRNVDEIQRVVEAFPFIRRRLGPRTPR